MLPDKINWKSDQAFFVRERKNVEVAFLIEEETNGNRNIISRLNMN